MSKIQRKTEVYSIGVRDKNTLKDIEKDINFSEILKMFFSYKSVYKIKDNKVFWFESCKIDDDIIEVIINYSKYNKNVKIINVETLKITKTKSKKEGDLEKQHILVKLLEHKNKAIMVFEKISDGIYVKSIEEKLNHFIKQNTSGLDGEVASTLDVEDVEDVENIEFYIKNVPNEDFLYELARMKRISVLRVFVDKTKSKIDEDIEFSERNISRDEYEIIYKPNRNLSFSVQNVEKYIREFLAGKSNKSKKIKKIVIEGKNAEGKLRLDTDGIKLSKYMETELDTDGNIKSEDIFLKYRKFVNEDYKDYLTNIILDIDEDEQIGDD
ncbi:hypothetical protein TthWC1_2580 [Thermoanaerobacter thermohydrosulfuricus WC1]|uniref:Uncharacterized protein n=2 Tax=Thermoanaerobacter TaxID=1754 RepID=D3T355_THEIA|nr:MULTISPECIES: hypothetical protein [Thermoanaerobacter]ADD02657.1 conserved hypothetical protein [Thermoanaerobacter italicus Ab9]EMT37940.1 hypothetical protein TthWC1_2580 [Thermoanaerobacter thermohydrosulfuricus WC1]